MKPIDVAHVPALSRSTADDASRYSDQVGDETFIERTRRIHALTEARKPRVLYARGLDSRQEDFA